MSTESSQASRACCCETHPHYYVTFEGEERCVHCSYYQCEIEDWPLPEPPYDPEDWSELDEAWLDGFRTAEAEAEELVGDKDWFIAKQTHLITEMMQVFDKAGVWDAVPAELREELRSYV